MSTLEVSAEEHAEIVNLYAAYNLASDAGDAEAYADCFMENGEHHGTYDVHGRAALIEYKKADKAKRTHLYRRHWNGSLHLEKIDAGTIRGRCYFFGYNGEPGSPPTMTHGGVYTDLIRKENGRWKFAERRIAFDFPSK